jgi:hypothetical protein
MLIADTGFFYALADKGDHYHTAARRTLASVTEPLITTYPVITETCYLLLIRQGNNAQCWFLKSLARGASEIFNLERHHFNRLSEVMER